MSNNIFPPPNALFDLYKRLSDEDATVFLRLLGTISTAGSITCFLHSLSKTEQDRFGKMMHQEVLALYYPTIVAIACRVAKGQPELSTEELERRVLEIAGQFCADTETAFRQLGQREEKEARDRKSDPATIKRDLQICDMKRKNPKLSLEQIARRFKNKNGKKLSKTYVKNVLDSEPELRRLAESLPKTTGR